MPTSAEPAPLRCHLLIGPPASGKTTLATVLAELVVGQVLSTDAIRAEKTLEQFVALNPTSDYEADYAPPS